MPITRRKRVNPPDQPENTNHLTDQPEIMGDLATQEVPSANVAQGVAGSVSLDGASEPSANARETLFSGENGANNLAPEGTAALSPSFPASNGERQEGNTAVQPHPTSIEGGKRTPRGELFRRPPLPPVPAVATPAIAAPLQAPTHEISLPLGKKPGDAHGDPLHLAYNPGYTGADEVRNALLHKLAQESRAGGRGRCWSCGAISIVYDRWNTRSKSLGEIGVAYCEICGVWSVM